MHKKKTQYVAKPVDAEGNAAYTALENQTWQTLITEQSQIIQNRACNEHLHGLQLLNLPTDRIPQCKEISNVLQDLTGWSLAPVPALIPFEQFFYLLANRRFPAATFIRYPEELYYLEEPDIFHEIFGHCPLLTHPAYADFAHTYGKLGLKASEEDRVFLARLYWFTVEFGLIRQQGKIYAYGGGILSSIKETTYSVESDVPDRLPFDVLEALRTPYRIDRIQPIYFVIDHFDTLFDLTNMDLMSLIQKAKALGLHEAIS
jgi:phenylalanine-4-hydroxylase